ncbi:hypothetical protein SSP24_54420 [Streptomyces spinoverrucosus]|uniref:Uncharacterized protein n=1 Tax=Streptomyces spinoverrucosus TaxID=284043 RepID=A0A4Y3VLQ8_9ACTN|nr:hypothetical protein SSP24_54420 [Streptomyces spinoverrucosus]GHB53441.1 hypothetical protein GCM10010397_24330 [Streptomyces spinoverrucosus]
MAAAQQQVRDEDGRRELDAGRDADGHALAQGAGRAGEVPEDQAGESEVDLAVEERLEDRFQPQGEGGGRAEGREAQGAAGESGREVDQAGGEQGVDREEAGFQGRYGDPGGGGEDERGEGGIGGGQVPLGDGEGVQVTAVQDGCALGPVHQGVGHGWALYDAQGGEGRDGDGEEGRGGCRA